MKLSPQSYSCTLLLVVTVTTANLHAPLASAFVSLGSPTCTSRTASSRDYRLAIRTRSSGGGPGRPNSKSRHRLHNGPKRRSVPLFSSSSSNNSNDANNERTVDKSRKNIIDAVVEEKLAGLAELDKENTTTRIRKRDIFKQALRDLASLSLIDYKWRSDLFKKAEADRLEEEYISRMMGEEYASYARPMDADDQRRGPLGNAERSAVQWLTRVIEEEGQRARLIASSDGELIRPKDLPSNTGPLSELERRAIQFLSEITDSEVERVRSGTLRPKDMKIRGPLGEAEARAVLALERIVESEKIRMERSRRMGDTVRPIDIPGPLGEFERYVGDIIRAERQRVKDREKNDGKLVRPKDASLPSGLGDVERKAVEDWELLTKEEQERFSSFKRFLSERRPVDVDGGSPLGVIEGFTVKLLNGPRLVGKVLSRVQELMSSQTLDEKDREILRNRLPEFREDEILEDEKNVSFERNAKKDDGLSP
ncbi:hypothetical protein HJC23_002305 [Cyclotella cryptica]|uniref:Uncharacterized protein n=1 Tax=Cyclotella cryptica TaxID=29204 RepID=A0ABD3QKN8_9STRA|eukprot:CCRYP_004380-RC/>CCRYP_004380-RC protein AED:0.28 eAED:0.28 QI:172/1/1/1/1/1/3/226/480